MTDQKTGTSRYGAVGEPELVGEPAVPQAPPRDRRRALRALARWTAAVVVFGAVGAGVAHGIAERERTDVPGLRTLGDGRWAYPRLARPVLPAGAPLPFAEDNAFGVHYAGLEGLLLPAPDGAKPVAVTATRDGFAAQFAAGSYRDDLRQELVDNGLRQVASRSWSTPDGTRTRIDLLRFPSNGFVNASPRCGTSMKLSGAEALEPDLDWDGLRQQMPAPGEARIRLYREAAPTGPEQTRAACLEVGDVQALITMTRKGPVPLIPFHQAVVLQDQLLR
ncbi:hypothetical protein [Streptomyces sp. NPDC089919]|uniref:hypothetical protein n=1 Tax=Streptomyces sp. NPDC089919 TaxID=3155188 RepID=UPI00343F354E